VALSLRALNSGTAALLVSFWGRAVAQLRVPWHFDMLSRATASSLRLCLEPEDLLGVPGPPRDETTKAAYVFWLRYPRSCPSRECSHCRCWHPLAELPCERKREGMGGDAEKRSVTHGDAPVTHGDAARPAIDLRKVDRHPGGRAILATRSCTSACAASGKARPRLCRKISLKRPRLLKAAMTANQSMTAEQAATLKRLSKAAYELDAFKANLTRAEADLRIAALAAKLKLLGEPPHTL
jgi:hypothetical protein